MSNTGRKWDILLTEYQGLKALSEAEEYFGDYAHTTAAHNFDKIIRERDFGTTNINLLPAAAKQEAMARGKIYDDHTNRHCDLFHIPAQTAAIALMKEPAPDMDAVLIKVKVARNYDLGDETYEPDFPRRPVDIIKDDVARLTQG